MKNSNSNAIIQEPYGILYSFWLQFDRELMCSFRWAWMMWNKNMQSNWKTFQLHTELVWKFIRRPFFDSMLNMFSWCVCGVGRLEWCKHACMTMVAVDNELKRIVESEAQAEREKCISALLTINKNDVLTMARVISSCNKRCLYKHALSWCGRYRVTSDYTEQNWNNQTIIEWKMVILTFGVEGDHFKRILCIALQYCPTHPMMMMMIIAIILLIATLIFIGDDDFQRDREREKQTSKRETLNPCVCTVVHARAQIIRNCTTSIVLLLVSSRTFRNCVDFRVVTVSFSFCNQLLFTLSLLKHTVLIACFSYSFCVSLLFFLFHFFGFVV